MSNNFKCYFGGSVNAFEYDYVAACFAPDWATAKRLMWNKSERLDEECDGEWIAARVTRQSQFDHLLDTKRTEAYVIYDISTTREMGWSSEGDSNCEKCGFATFDGEFPLCESCECCDECGHDEECELAEGATNENHLDRHLKTYTETGRKDKGNGISHVQRICRIGYNQARRMVNRGIETGVLINDPAKDYLHRIAPSMSEDRADKSSVREFGEPE